MKYEDLSMAMNRRTFLRRSAGSIGTLALASLLDPLLLNESAQAQNAAKNAGDKWRGVAYPLPYKQRIKRVIHLYMAGGPSHLETFDPKPKLAEMNGKPIDRKSVV